LLTAWGQDIKTTIIIFKKKKALIEQRQSKTHPLNIIAQSLLFQGDALHKFMPFGIYTVVNIA